MTRNDPEVVFADFGERTQISGLVKQPAVVLGSTAENNRLFIIVADFLKTSTGDEDYRELQYSVIRILLRTPGRGSTHRAQRSQRVSLIYPMIHLAYDK